MPRLPTEMAMVSPGLILGPRSRRWTSVRTAAGMSSTVGAEKCWRTRIMRGRDMVDLLNGLLE